jgi:hypothetical protein
MYQKKKDTKLPQNIPNGHSKALKNSNICIFGVKKIISGIPVPYPGEVDLEMIGNKKV